MKHKPENRMTDTGWRRREYSFTLEYMLIDHCENCKLQLVSRSTISDREQRECQTEGALNNLKLIKEKEAEANMLKFLETEECHGERRTGEQSS
jgi:hypothetical protein